MPSPQTTRTDWARTIAISAIAILTFVAHAHAQANSEIPAPRIPDLSQVFVLFFVMLGPIKIIAPFATMTKEAEEASARKLAIRAFAIASVTTLLAAAIGRAILENWHVSLGALLIAGGVILFLVALRQVLQQYAPAPEMEARQPETGLAAMAIRRGTAYPPFDPVAETAFDGRVETALATAVGVDRYEGAALVAAA